MTLSPEVYQLLERCWIAMFAIQNSLEAEMTLTTDHPDVTDLSPIMKEIEVVMKADDVRSAQLN